MVNRKNYIITSVWTTVLLQLVCWFITRDYMVLIDNILYLYNGGVMERLGLLMIIPFKAFLDFSVFLALYSVKEE